MEKSQYELCLEVLRRLNNAGVLRDVILIGSWCVPFYKDYFAGTEYPSAIKTRDIDFLVPKPAKVKAKTDIAELLKDLGFIVNFKGAKGYFKLEHPELVVEFLTPEKGKGTDRPVRIPNLGVNAQSLRFLNFLADHTIHVEVEGMLLTLPHPANFGLHKIIISQRRSNKEKGVKDYQTGLQVLKALIEKGDSRLIKRFFMAVPGKWQEKIVRVLKKSNEEEILNLLIEDSAL